MLSLYNFCVCEYRPLLSQTRKIDDANYLFLLRRHTIYSQIFAHYSVGTLGCPE